MEEWSIRLCLDLTVNSEFVLCQFSSKVFVVLEDNPPVRGEAVALKRPRGTEVLSL